MAIIVEVLNGTNLTSDFGLQSAVSAMLTAGVRKNFQNECEVVAGKVQTGFAFVEVERNSISPAQSFLIPVSITEEIAIDTSGDGFVILKIDQNKINDGSTNSEDGTGIATVEKVAELPAKNFLLLASLSNGEITDQRDFAQLRERPIKSFATEAARDEILTEPENGEIVFIEELDGYRGFRNGSWGKLADPSENIVNWYQDSTDDDSITGEIDGTNCTFVLSTVPASAAACIVSYNGIVQELGESDDYTIDGKTITFNSPPENGKIVAIYPDQPILVGANQTRITPFSAASVGEIYRKAEDLSLNYKKSETENELVITGEKVETPSIYTPAKLIGGTEIQGNYLQWRTIIDGTLSVLVDGENKSLTGLDFGLVNSMEDVTNILQNALPSADFFFETDHFEIHSKNTTANSAISFCSGTISGAGFLDLSGNATKTFAELDQSKDAGKIATTGIDGKLNGKLLDIKTALNVEGNNTILIADNTEKNGMKWGTLQEIATLLTLRTGGAKSLSFNVGYGQISIPHGLGTTPKWVRISGSDIQSYQILVNGKYIVGNGQQCSWIGQRDPNQYGVQMASGKSTQKIIFFEYAAYNPYRTESVQVTANVTETEIQLSYNNSGSSTKSLSAEWEVGLF